MSFVIHTESRTEQGKEAIKRVRDAGKVPAIFYGFGVSARSLSVEPKSLEKALANPKGLNGYFELTVDGVQASQRVLIRELQRDAVSRAVLHLDLVAPNPTKEIVAVVPLKFEGRSIGVSTGGRMRKPFREVRVQGLPEHIPGEIVIDVTNVDQGDTLYASQLSLNGAKVLFDRDFIIVKVVAPRGRKS
ncbi:MAG: 50S ribosomal protein L25 [Deltaproteobacteria bacterium]|nr:50S ribosomal protein L25 [Deltaproteobacteria bacterium]